MNAEILIKLFWRFFRKEKVFLGIGREEMADPTSNNKEKRFRVLLHCSLISQGATIRTR